MGDKLQPCLTALSTAKTSMLSFGHSECSRLNNSCGLKFDLEAKKMANISG